MNLLGIKNFQVSTSIAISLFVVVTLSCICIAQAMEKDRPWRMKDSRVLEILQAVCPVFVHAICFGFL